jgi:hypothetical protein
MNERSKGLEFYVGLFVVVGLAALAALVVQFGRVGEGFKTYYDLTVHFENASGLLKSSDVLMSGAKVGRVAGGLKLNASGEGVVVSASDFRLREDPGRQQIHGRQLGPAGRSLRHDLRSGGAAEGIFAARRADRRHAADRHGRPDHQGGELIKDLRNTVQNINGTFTRLNEQALSTQNMESLKSTLDKFEPNQRHPGRIDEEDRRRAGEGRCDDGVVEKGGRMMCSSRSPTLVKPSLRRPC